MSSSVKDNYEVDEVVSIDRLTVYKDLEDDTVFPVAVEVKGLDDTYESEWLDVDQVKELALALSKSVGEADIQHTTDPNEAKLLVAAEFGLKARFEYRGEADLDFRVRRIEVSDLVLDESPAYVVGYDAEDDGQTKRFRLDRVRGSVAIA
jgi:predicted DNA-binding transcriptional regulator YafY